SNDQDFEKTLTCRRHRTFNSIKPTRTMPPDYIDFLIKRFENPDEVRTFERGQFELIKIGGMTIGRATYEPGWRWSQHVATVAGTSLCQVEHVGMVISGQAACAMEDRRSYIMKSGHIFTSVLGTIVGWWAINLMFRFTFSERKNTRMTERTSPVSKSTAPHYMLASVCELNRFERALQIVD